MFVCFLLAFCYMTQCIFFINVTSLTHIFFVIRTCWGDNYISYLCFRDSNQQKVVSGGSAQLVAAGGKALSLLGQQHQIRMERRWEFTHAVCILWFCVYSLKYFIITLKWSKTKIIYVSKSKCQKDQRQKLFICLNVSDKRIKKKIFYQNLFLSKWQNHICVQKAYLHKAEWKGSLRPGCDYFHDLQPGGFSPGELLCQTVGCRI